MEKLGCLLRLIELSVISNPVSINNNGTFYVCYVKISRRMQHRTLLVYRLPSLQSLDGVAVTNEERQTADITFSDRHVQVCSSD